MAPTTGQLRVLIGASNPGETTGTLRGLLEGLGHSVAGVASEGRDTVAKADSLAPEVIFLDIPMQRPDGIETIQGIMGRRPAPIILLTEDTSPELIERATTAGVMGYLVKPINTRDVAPMIALAVTRFADLMALRRDVRALQDALVLRRDLERAKGILGQRMRLSEQEAHRRLKALAKRDRCTLGEAAARVIAANTFFSELEDMT